MQVGARFEKQEKISIIKDYTASINYQADCTLINNQTTCESNGYCDWDDNQSTCEENLFKDILGTLASENKLNNKYEHERVYPSLYFLYNLHSGGNLKLELGRRINRPNHVALNPIPDLSQEDRNFIDQGNPNLNPEDIYKSEFSYSGRLPIGFLKTAIYYTKIEDKIDRDKTTYQDSNQNNFMILTWNNVAKSTGTGMEMTFVTQPLPNWDIVFNGFYWHNELEGIQLDQQGAEFGFWGMINSTLRLPNKQEIGLYSHSSTPMRLITGEIEPFRRTDLSYKKKVNDKFNFTIKLKDIFDTSGFGIKTDQLIDTDADNILDQREILTAEHRRNKKSVSINFEYRFGAFQKKKYRREGGHGHSHGDEGMEQGF